jgi:hypothetical protein
MGALSERGQPAKHFMDKVETVSSGGRVLST